MNTKENDNRKYVVSTYNKVGSSNEISYDDAIKLKFQRDKIEPNKQHFVEIVKDDEIIFKMSMKLSRDMAYYSDRWNPERLDGVYKKLDELMNELINQAHGDYRKGYESLKKKSSTSINKDEEKSEISVTKSKLICCPTKVSDAYIIDMEVGRTYGVNIYSENNGECICNFISGLENIVIDTDLTDEKNLPDGFISKLIFKNGVILNEPQYNSKGILDITRLVIY